MSLSIKDGNGAVQQLQTGSGDGSSTPFVSPLANTVGNQNDSSATTDTGTFSLMGFIKRLLVKIPSLGTALIASSVPVNLASDQIIPIKPSTGTLTDKSGTITSGATAQTLAAVNASRKYLFIQNNSSGDLWINFTTTAVVSQPSIKLPQDSSLTFNGPFISTELVSIIGATTGQTFTAKEG